jgi:hypothetical protein
MWKSLQMVALAGLLAAGCKEAGVDRPADKTADDTTEAGSAGRSGKVDFGRRRGTQPGDSTGAAAGDGVGYQPGDVRPGMEERRRQRIAQFDHDGDGKISDEERKAARRRRAEDLRKNADANGDGKVTPDELAKGNFRRLAPESVDTNKDGDISIEEIESALEQRNRAWGGGRKPGDLGSRFGRPFGRGSAATGDAGSGSAAPN